MMIPQELKKKYIKDFADIDTALFLSFWDEVPGGKVLAVGAHDEPTANILAEMGYDVTGVDLRGYDENLPPQNYKFLHGDFCNPKVISGVEVFDQVVCLSAVEHFGLSAYGEQQINVYYDIIAMRKIWELLKYGGRAYISVPMGSHYLEVWPHWRVYDFNSARDRLVQNFYVSAVMATTANTIEVDGRRIKARDLMTFTEISGYSGIPPCVSTLFVLEKVKPL